MFIFMRNVSISKSRKKGEVFLSEHFAKLRKTHQPNGCTIFHYDSYETHSTLFYGILITVHSNYVGAFLNEGKFHELRQY